MVNFDPTINLSTLLQLPILAGVFYVVRFIVIQKDFPPHRHINGHVLYPKGYTPDPERAKSASAGD